MRRRAVFAGAFALLAASAPAWAQQPPPQYGAQPAPQYGAQPAPQYGAQPAPQYGAQPAPQYGGQPPPQYGGQPPGPQPYGGQYGAAPPVAPRPAPEDRESSLFEIGTLYAAAVGYGVGLGIWFDAELGLEDPGLLLIPPAVLGIAAPVGVYFLDQPSMPRGKPGAIAAGLAIGAAEGLGIAGTQFVTAKKADAWGFRGLARSVAIGATVGGVGGYVVGEFQEPSPRLSAFVTSGALWGTLIGGSIGYGASPEGVGYGRSNDSGAIGGLIGLNVGLAATAGLSLVTVPGWSRIGGMWLGAGIGAAASLPVFLFYAGENTPPAKRGLVFSGTAVALGITAGAVFAGDDEEPRRRAGDPSGDGSSGVASVTHVFPFMVPGGAGVACGGVLY